jgi:molybdate transport system regulatory protein
MRESSIEHRYIQPDIALSVNHGSICPGHGCIGYSFAMATLTLRLDLAPGQSIGHGKIRLLEAVRDYGSISAAGRSMRMSYRRAWMLIDELNRMFVEPLIETKHGGTAGGGAELTAFGQRVVERYRSIEANALAAGADDLADLAAAVGRGPMRKTRRKPQIVGTATAAS